MHKCVTEKDYRWEMLAGRYLSNTPQRLPTISEYESQRLPSSWRIWCSRHCATGVDRSSAEAQNAATQRRRMEESKVKKMDVMEGRSFLAGKGIREMYITTRAQARKQARRDEELSTVEHESEKSLSIETGTG